MRKLFRPRYLAPALVIAAATALGGCVYAGPPFYAGGWDHHYHSYYWHDRWH